MSEYAPVSTKEDLSLLDENDVVEGYRAGCRGESEPGSAFSRSYWHGWRNGMVDSQRMEKDVDQARLARDVLGTYTGLH